MKRSISTTLTFSGNPLVPAGTGMEYYRNVQLSPELEEAAAQVQQEVTAAIAAEERELEQMRMEGEQEELAAE